MPYTTDVKYCRYLLSKAHPSHKKPNVPPYFPLIGDIWQKTFTATCIYSHVPEMKWTLSTKFTLIPPQPHNTQQVSSRRISLGLHLNFKPFCIVGKSPNVLRTFILTCKICKSMLIQFHHTRVILIGVKFTCAVFTLWLPDTLTLKKFVFGFPFDFIFIITPSSN